jgi:hypothetical protein
MMEGMIHAVLGAIRKEGVVSNRINQIVAMHSQTVDTEEFFRIYMSIITECILFLKKT